MTCSVVVATFVAIGRGGLKGISENYSQLTCISLAFTIFWELRESIFVPNRKKPDPHVTLDYFSTLLVLSEMLWVSPSGRRLQIYSTISLIDGLGGSSIYRSSRFATCRESFSPSFGFLTESMDFQYWWRGGDLKWSNQTTRQMIPSHCLTQQPVV